MRGMNSKPKKRMDTMKNILVIVALVLCVAGCVSKCAKWQAENDQKALESCKMIHSDEQCRAWIGRGY